jgi:DNA-binding NarL/FixJ family response regulator
MKRIRLFLVDDEPQVRRGLRMRLEMEDDFLVVGDASDGAAAIAKVAEERPDVVLMDVQMPDCDGIAVARKMRAAAPASAVIIVSMQDDAGTRARAFAAGAAGFVGKHEIDVALTTAIRNAAAQIEEQRCSCRRTGAGGEEEIAHIEEEEETR